MTFMIKSTETLYRRVGRRYVAVKSSETYEMDTMPVNSFRLVYAYKDGGRRYEYDVTPATAPTAAAMLIAKQAMCEAIKEASKMRPNSQIPYTKKQKSIIDKFRQDMGGLFPSWWVENSDYVIADAAIKAVLEYRP